MARPKREEGATQKYIFSTKIEGDKASETSDDTSAQEDSYVSEVGGNNPSVSPTSPSNHRSRAQAVPESGFYVTCRGTIVLPHESVHHLVKIDHELTRFFAYPHDSAIEAVEKLQEAIGRALRCGALKASSNACYFLSQADDQEEDSPGIVEHKSRAQDDAPFLYSGILEVSYGQGSKLYDTLRFTVNLQRDHALRARLLVYKFKTQRGQKIFKEKARGLNEIERKFDQLDPNLFQRLDDGDTSPDEEALDASVDRPPANNSPGDHPVDDSAPSNDNNNNDEVDAYAESIIEALSQSDAGHDTDATISMARSSPFQAESNAERTAKPHRGPQQSETQRDPPSTSASGVPFSKPSGQNPRQERGLNTKTPLPQGVPGQKHQREDSDDEAPIAEEIRKRRRNATFSLPERAKSSSLPPSRPECPEAGSVAQSSQPPKAYMPIVGAGRIPSPSPSLTAPFLSPSTLPNPRGPLTAAAPVNRPAPGDNPAPENNPVSGSRPTPMPNIDPLCLQPLHAAATGITGLYPHIGQVPVGGPSQSSQAQPALPTAPPSIMPWLEPPTSALQTAAQGPGHPSTQQGTAQGSGHPATAHSTQVEERLRRDPVVWTVYIRGRNLLTTTSVSTDPRLAAAVAPHRNNLFATLSTLEGATTGHLAIVSRLVSQIDELEWMWDRLGGTGASTSTGH